MEVRVAFCSEPETVDHVHGCEGGCPVLPPQPSTAPFWQEALSLQLRVEGSACACITPHYGTRAKKFWKVYDVGLFRTLSWQ